MGPGQCGTQGHTLTATINYIVLDPVLQAFLYALPRKLRIPFFSFRCCRPAGLRRRTIRRSSYLGVGFRDLGLESVRRLSQIEGDMWQQGVFHGVRRGDPAGPDHLATLDARLWHRGRCRLPDVDRVPAGLKGDRAMPGVPQRLRRQLDPELLPEFPAGSPFRRFPPSCEPARQRITAAITRADQEDLTAVPQGYCRPVRLGSPHEPPDPQHEIRPPIPHAHGGRHKSLGGILGHGFCDASGVARRLLLRTQSTVFGASGPNAFVLVIPTCFSLVRLPIAGAGREPTRPAGV